jgi:hypothetical protein
MAADNWKVAPWHGARYVWTHMRDLNLPPGVRRDGTHAGRRSQPEERHGMEAEVLRIDRRRKNRYREFLVMFFRTRHILWNDDSIRVSEQPFP